MVDNFVIIYKCILRKREIKSFKTTSWYSFGEKILLNNLKFSQIKLNIFSNHCLDLISTLSVCMQLQQKTHVLQYIVAL